MPKHQTGSGPSAELELRGYFSGRRNGARVREQFEIVVQGRAGSFQAHAVDVSRTGVLIEITDPIYQRDHDLASFADQVIRHFGTGAGVSIVAAETIERANLVRVTQHGGKLLVAFQFKAPLPPSVCHALRLPETEDVDSDLASPEE